MQIVDVTPEEAVLVRTGGIARPNARPETKAVLALKVNHALRIVAHEHTVSGRDCILAITLSAAGRLHGMKITRRHDGADLLVGRLK